MSIYIYVILTAFLFVAAVDLYASCIRRKNRTHYWIYPGERRPVVVMAKDRMEAIRLVEKSPDYDGFAVFVYRVEEFAELCAHGETP